MAEINIKEIISDLAEKIMKDEKLQKQFATEPVKALEELIGRDLPDEKVEKVIDLIEAKLEDTDVEAKLAALGDKVEDFGDDLKDKVEGFFKKLDRD